MAHKKRPPTRAHESGKPPLLSGNATKTQCRLDFLAAAVQVEPRVREELEEILPLYSAYSGLPDVFDDGAETPDHRIHAWAIFDDYDRRELIYWADLEASSATELSTHLRGWATRFNFIADSTPIEWVLDIAMQTLHHWKSVGSSEKRWCARSIAVQSVFEDEMAFDVRIEDDGWDPALEPNDAFRARLEEKFGSEVARYQERMRDLSQQRQFESPRTKHSKQHYEWTALRVLKQQSPLKIAEKTSGKVLEQTVAKAIQRTRNLIDI